jgi:hypothetical protein
VVVARARWADRGSWRVDVDLWLWLATGCVAVVAGFRFYGHYWLQLLPPLVLLVAPRAAALRPARVRLALVATLAPAVVAFGLALIPGTVRTLENPAPIARAVNRMPPGPILVWGNYPDLYWAADRPVAGGFVTSNFVTGLSGNRAPGPGTLGDATPGALATFMTELRAHPPVVIVDTSTADLRQYGAYPLRVVPALVAFMRARHYRPYAHVDGVTLYEPVVATPQGS